MRSRTLLTAVLASFGGLVPAFAQEQPAHRFLQGVVGFTAAQIAEVDRGQVVTKPLPAADKPEIAAFGAVFVGADEAALLVHLRNVPDSRRGPSVLEIGRLGNPPRVDDFGPLTADEVDLDALRKCRPGDCGIKVARSALGRLQREANWSPSGRAGTTALLKQMLGEYAAAYMKGGTAEMATFDLYRARVDPPTGMLSGVLLGKVRAGIEQGVAESLRTAKAKAEGR